MSTCMHVYGYMHVYVCVCVSVCVCVCVYDVLYIYGNMHVCTYVDMYVWSRVQFQCCYSRSIYLFSGTGSLNGLELAK